MFRSLSIKWVALMFVAYNLLNVVLTGVAVQWWLSHQPGIIDAQSMMVTAETDPAMAIVTAVIGGLSALITGGYLLFKTRPLGNLSLYAFSGLLTLFGLASIFAHPEHAIWQQLGKLLAPAFVCWILVHTRLGLPARRQT